MIQDHSSIRLDSLKRLIDRERFRKLEVQSKQLEFIVSISLTQRVNDQVRAPRSAIHSEFIQIRYLLIRF